MKPGIVGRFVSVEVQRGEAKTRESCEVVACQYSNYNWRILVVTSEGALLSYAHDSAKLVAEPGASEGPYR